MSDFRARFSRSLSITSIKHVRSAGWKAQASEGVSVSHCLRYGPDDCLKAPKKEKQEEDEEDLAFKKRKQEEAAAMKAARDKGTRHKHCHRKPLSSLIRCSCEG